MMLTGDLLRVRVKGRTLQPSWVDPTNTRLQERAADVLAVFNQAAALHWTRGQVDAAVRELEGIDTQHRLTRGFAKVLHDKCVFEMDCPVEPPALRHRVFRLAAATGPLARRAGPTGRRTAADVLSEVADQLAQAPVPPGEDGGGPGAALTTEELSAALYADLKDEQVLLERTGPDSAEALLHRYNVALVQALLLRASKLTVRLARPDPKRLRQLFRYLKFFQLMVRVGGTPTDLVIEVDGPQSLLKQSTRYGMKLAQFFPAILLQTGAWTAEAEILWGKARKLRKQLVLAHTRGLQSHYRDRGAWRSNAEQWFEERFEALETGWSLHPGELLDLGGQRVLAPDFTFRQGGRVAHLDIVGFWRRGYLRKRVAETPDNVILAVSKRLVGEPGALPESLAKRVVLFAEVINAKKVLARIEAVAQPAG